MGHTMTRQLLTSLLAFGIIGTASCQPSDPAPSNTLLVNSCNKSHNAASITKPTGVYTSVITAGAAANTTINGGLIRVNWAELEPAPDQFDFSAIDSRLALLPAGKKWSLGIHGGWSSLNESDPDFAAPMAAHMSPAWLESDYAISTFDMEFRNVTVHMPKYWDATLQARLASMLQTVATHYQNDERLQLVYVPQMTSNGIEGHFNGVPNSTLISAAGINPNQSNAAQLFENLWVDAALTVAKSTALAFSNKAVAFEVHEVIDRVSIPQRIMDGLLQDADFGNRAGVAMWWISGGTTYQSNLVQALSQYQGDVYGQVIGKSSQTYRYPNNDYSQVFSQAKALCMRYIEPWNYEFENNTLNDLMTDFNQFAQDSFD